MAKSPQDMKASMIAGLAEKTGKPLEQWLSIIKSAGLAKHGLTHGFANMIALQALGSDSHTAANTGSLLDAQYAGAKAALRPIYDAVIQATIKFGKDVDIAPKKSYVSLRRSKQFAIVQPSSSSRVDVGINLPDVKAGKRLEASGSFNAMLSHRVRVTDVSDVDAELVEWLKLAYKSA
jgi:predicted transport protein